MTLTQFLQQLKKAPDTMTFQQTMDVVAENYRYTPTAFKNGEAVNQAGTNEGSCKLFAFAQLNQLDKDQTLACFGDYYRIDVLQNPEGSDHANIRNFMVSGWQGIHFEGAALAAR